ncbi:MAG: hypothetical protein VX916_05000 [Planctomycetota bacterium]|nr:hypothetical protein [Planctomycetota bacterium]
MIRCFALLSVLIGLCLPSCGKRVGNEGDAPWPMHLSSPGVTGTLVLPRAGDGRVLLATWDLFHWIPDGLAPWGPAVVIMLDPSTYDGSFAVCFPVDEEIDFVASIEEVLTAERIDDYRIRLSTNPESHLWRAWRFLGALSKSPPEAMAAMVAIAGNKGRSESVTCYVAVQDGWGMVAPAFEALGVCQTALEQMPGVLALRDGPAPVGAPAVLTLDLGRLRKVHRERFAMVEEWGRFVVQAGGMANRQEENSLGDRAMRWGAVSSALEMIGWRDWKGLQLLMPWNTPAAGPSPPPGTALDESGFAQAVLAPLESSSSLHWSLDSGEGSSLEPLLQSLAPLPLRQQHNQRAPLLEVSFRPESLGMLAGWILEFADLFVEEGDDKWGDVGGEQLAEHLSPFSGLLLVTGGEGPCVFLPLKPENNVDVATLMGFINHAEGGVTFTEDGDETWVIRQGDGSVIAKAGLLEGVFWICPEESQAPSRSVCADVMDQAAFPRPESGASLRLDGEIVEASLVVEGSVLHGDVVWDTE